jgi:hypothetical protein
LDKSSLFGIWWRKDITGERAVEPIEHRAGGERGWAGGQAFPSMLFYYYYYFVKSYISLSLIRIIILMFNGINVFYMFISISLIRIIILMFNGINVFYMFISLSLIRIIYYYYYYYYY